MAVDPYVTLGLQPGATPAEIKRAYRRLAKAFHPDSAGENALPRFLAIHEAYEQLITGRRSSRGTAATTASPASDPWRADPARARAAREQARTRRTRPTAGGTRPGAGGGPGPAGNAAADAGANAEGRAGAGGRSGRGSSKPPGTTPGAAGDRPRRRSVRKATLGSTSYDEARDPADPAWGGAAWYGPTSGEYWRVNPREYADPRKHGPEYQSRARRGFTTGSGTADPVDDVGRVPEEPAAGLPPDPTASFNSAAGRRDRSWTPPEPRVSGEAGPPAREAETSPTLASLLEPEVGDPVRRLGFALLAWAPLGVASAAAIGQATGCSSYAATCTGTEPLLPWLAQATILGILLLLPALSRVLAVGTVAIVVALLPVAGFFIAFGGAGQPEGAGVLIVALATAWLAGVAIAARAAWHGRVASRAADRAI